MQLEEVVRREHDDYYAAGGFDCNRFRWSVDTFLPNCRGKCILEIGCGDDELLSLLLNTNEVHGVDASERGFEKCFARDIPALCLDAGSQPLPFPSDYFDSVIILETLEHLMNPYYALLDIRRVLKENARLVCSVPSSATGHLYLYPGLFEFSNFTRFLRQLEWTIERIEPWQWAPREAFLPVGLRGNRVLKCRYLTGNARRVVERGWRMAGEFPWFCYWLWTFGCVNVNNSIPTILAQPVQKTRPKAKMTEE